MWVDMESDLKEIGGWVLCRPKLGLFALPNKGGTPGSQGGGQGEP